MLLVTVFWEKMYFSVLKFFQIALKKFNLEIEEQRFNFLREIAHRESSFSSIILHGKGFHDLRNLFRKEEIESLLSDSCKLSEVTFIEIVFFSHYKFEPAAHEELRRTTPLHQVFELGNLYRAILLFKIYERFVVNCIDERGISHFHVACRYGQINMIRKLLILELGRADPNCPVPETGDTPLMLTLRSSCKESKQISELLLRHGADPTLANKDGRTALHFLSERLGSVELAQMLFKHRREPVQVDAQDEFGETPLLMALGCKNTEMAELLLRRGANPNLTDDRGRNALHFVCERFSCGYSVDEFLKICDDTQPMVQIDAKDNLGRTPLTVAVASIMPKSVDQLLNRGADLSNFVFPTETYLNDQLKNWTGLFARGYKLGLTSGALVILERLESGGYELGRSDALTIMKLFAKHRSFEKNSSDLEKRWFDDEMFKRQAEEIFIIPSLSLYDLVQMEPEQEDQQLTYLDYFNFWISDKFCKLPERSIEPCVVHLCEIMSRGFFRRWTLYPFWELIHYRLEIECCEPIIKQLANEDLFNICLAATIENQKDSKEDEIANEINSADERSVRA